MEPVETVYHYHDRTKHRPERYARSLGYLDWATQPDPFRRYEGAPRIPLPLALQHPTPPYHLLESADLPAAPLVRESVSQLMQFSLGLAAWKRFGDQRWALRCNASSGNLHPTEAYLILPPLPGVANGSTLCHYAPQEHALEVLSDFQTEFWNTLPKGSLLIGLSSVLWREAWKYGERSFRYCQLDAGHAWRAVEVSAQMLGWHCERLRGYGNGVLEKLLGLDQDDRFRPHERESADMLLLITPKADAKAVFLESLIRAMPTPYTGRANRLSPSHHLWELIDTVDAATAMAPLPLPPVRRIIAKRAPGMSAGEVVLKRRSAQMMDASRASITKGQFMQMLHSVDGSLDGCECSTDLLLFVHQVEELKPGLYLCLRNPAHLDLLQEGMHDDFIFEEIEPSLFFLREGDFRFEAKHISCNQEIAKDGAFTLGMLCAFSQQIAGYGAQRYKELYHECGAIGQQLYLEATSLGLSATGIGCFLDDRMHALLGLRDETFQSLYHFTVGRAIVDTRLTTEPPYTLP